MGVLGWVITGVFYLLGLLALGLASVSAYENQERQRRGNIKPGPYIGLFVVIAALYSLLFASWLR